MCLIHIGTEGNSINGKDYGEPFVKMNTSGTILDYFTPYDQANINSADFDLGAAGPLLLPDQPGAHPHLMVSAGKNKTIYLVDRDNMGHIEQFEQRQPDCSVADQFFPSWNSGTRQLQWSGVF